MECFLGNVAVKIHDIVDQNKKTATGRKKIMPMIRKYYPGRFDDLSVEEFIEKHDNTPMEEIYYFNVGSFSNYTPERVQKMMDELGVESSSEVLMPSTDMTDLEELKEVLEPEEYEKIVKEKKGTFTKVAKPLMAGNVYMEQLYHIPSYSNKVTSDMTVNMRNANPVAPRGAIRDTGQKIKFCIEKYNNQFSKNYIKCWKVKIINQQCLNKFSYDYYRCAKRVCYPDRDCKISGIE